jgi:hypothetical protein
MKHRDDARYTRVKTPLALRSRGVAIHTDPVLIVPSDADMHSDCHVPESDTYSPIHTIFMAA